MGFFDLKSTCAVCDEEVGLNRYQISNKEWVCLDCFKKAGGLKIKAPIKKMTVQDFKDAICDQEKNMEEFNAFNATKKIGALIEFDDNQMKWLIPDGFWGGKKNPKVYDYSDIVDFELLEDGESVSKGGLGRAVAGGVLFGGVGAIVGGVTGGKKNKAICNSMKIKITINNLNNPVVYINLISI
jgi:hypothetical protein